MDGSAVEGLEALTAGELNAAVRDTSEDLVEAILVRLCLRRELVDAMVVLLVACCLLLDL
jgi:hypothetical protein